MISDNGLNTLAIFLGSAAMLLVVLYHFLEINAKDEATEERIPALQAAAAQKAGKAGSR